MKEYILRYPPPPIESFVMISLRVTLRSSRGAIDLASIMVGVIIIGLIGGVIAATVFAVIPWSQDKAAKQQLDSVHTAQNAFFGLSSDPSQDLTNGKKNSFANSTELAQSNLLVKNVGYCTVATEDNKNYVGFSKSASGKWFTASNSKKQAVEYTGTVEPCVVSGTDAGTVNPEATPGSGAVTPTPTTPAPTQPTDVYFNNAGPSATGTGTLTSMIDGATFTTPVVVNNYTTQNSVTDTNQSVFNLRSANQPKPQMKLNVGTLQPGTYTFSFAASRSDTKYSSYSFVTGGVTETRNFPASTSFTYQNWFEDSFTFTVGAATNQDMIIAFNVTSPNSTAYNMYVDKIRLVKVS